MTTKNPFNPPQKAMLLAAGMGKRLQPLTLEVPKPLVPVCLTPMLYLHLKHFASLGIRSVIINTHYLASKIHNFLETYKAPPLLTISHEHKILGTGGGIFATKKFWGEQPAALIVNGDILTDYDLISPYYDHLNKGNHVTLLLHRHPHIKGVSVDEEMNITGFYHGPWAFTGIHYIALEVFDKMPSGLFHIIDFYQTLIQQGFKVRGVMAKGTVWWDIGSLNTYLKAHLAILTHKVSIPVLRGVQNPLLGKDVHIDQDVTFKGAVAIGNGVHIGKGASLTNCIVWDGALVNAGEVLKSCIITPRIRVLVEDCS